mmetsp:Transcript_47910/g.121573  ORF Transcript_47910/g.121573 Transcript_47910/m.121573 type:complete len:211 (-) Transcript_47910:482-1114(-)
MSRPRCSPHPLRCSPGFPAATPPRHLLDCWCGTTLGRAARRSLDRLHRPPLPAGYPVPSAPASTRHGAPRPAAADRQAASEPTPSVVSTAMLAPDLRARKGRCRRGACCSGCQGCQRAPFRHSSRPMPVPARSKVAARLMPPPPPSRRSAARAAEARRAASLQAVPAVAHGGPGRWRPWMPRPNPACRRNSEHDRGHHVQTEPNLGQEVA